MNKASIPTNAPERVFIVGLYKSGTSWLTEILNEHPAIRGINEIDIVRCINGLECSEFAVLPPKEIIKNVFGRSAVLNLPKSIVDGCDYRAIQDLPAGFQQGADIYDLGSEELIPLLWKIGSKEPVVAGEAEEPAASDAVEALSRKVLNLNRQQLKKMLDCALELKGRISYRNLRICHKVASREKNNRPMAYESIDMKAASRLVDQVRAEGDPQALLSCIAGMFEANLKEERVVVYKGADQIARLPLLESWSPESKKIVIVRDARDAMISAQHFRKLMMARGASFTPKDAVTDFYTLLKGWNSRARMVLQYASQGKVKVIRYEDLLLDFERVMSELYSWLGVAAEPELVREIKLATSFRVTTGRSPGKEKNDSVRRKGVMGEWKHVLDGEAQRKAWEISGQFLEPLGYTRSGRLRPFEL